jgi:hypothetical protein
VVNKPLMMVARDESFFQVWEYSILRVHINRFSLEIWLTIHLICIPLTFHVLITKLMLLYSCAYKPINPLSGSIPPDLKLPSIRQSKIIK